jgi:transposase
MPTRIILFVYGYLMSFIKKSKRNGKTYLNEVENKWINGKCVQKHIRYIGTEADGETKLAASISDIVVEDVKVFGPLIILHHIAKEIGLPNLLGEYAPEILSLVYAHCLSYQSINRMPSWFKRTDLSVLLDIENVTEKTLLNALDSLEKIDTEKLQLKIFNTLNKKFHVSRQGLVYDVTNTYLYGKKCPLGKFGHDKEGVKGRPLIQIALAVTQEKGMPLFHKVFDGNIHDARTLQDVVSTMKQYKIKTGLLIYDRGITSAENIMFFMICTGIHYAVFQSEIN